jgi:7-cyano-7-deazaguanine synthase
MSSGLLISGGMDSVALAFWKRPQFGYTVDYGQLAAEGEIRAATAVCQALSIQHRIIKVNCRSIGLGDMAGTAPSSHSPVSEWWPFRNQLIITFAGAGAVADGVSELMVGAILTDVAHCDGRPEFFKRISSAMEFQEGNILVTAPAIHLDGVELIKASAIPFEILAWSHSCHVSNFACGVCRGCTKHAETMSQLGYGDY